MTSCGSILQQQLRAQQLVACLGDPPAPPPMPATCQQHAEPTQDLAPPHMAPALPGGAGAQNYGQAPLPQPPTEPMDEALCAKRLREPSDGLDSDRAPSDEERDAMEAAPRRAAAIAPSSKRRARGGEAVTSRGRAALPAPAPLLLAVAPATGAPPPPPCLGESTLPAAPSPGSAVVSASPPLQPLAPSFAAAAFSSAQAAAQDGGAQEVNKLPPGSALAHAAACGGRSGGPTPSKLPGEDEEGQWVTQRSKAAKRKARKVAARRPITLPAAGTCLFRPADRATSFLATSREVIARELAATPGVSQVRVNTRLNVVAADAETDECLAALLGTQSIAGIAVRAGRPAKRGTSRGLVFGVDPRLGTDEILANCDCEVAVSSVVRKTDGALLLDFASSSPPQFVAIFKLLLPVRGCRPRPTQCARCGRLDHVTACCRGKERCARCGGGHAPDQCTASAPRCSNCGGAHAVDNPRCPRWQQERQVATAMARAPQPVPRAVAVASVRAGQQLPSYADMARRSSSPQQHGTQQQQRRSSQQQQQQHHSSPQQQPTTNHGLPQRQQKSVRRPPAPQPVDQQPPAGPAAPSQDQLVPLLLALVHSLVGRLPADDPDRLAATAALASLTPTPAPQHG